MSIWVFYPPIAAATFVFGLWAVLLYTLYKRDLPRGDGGESVAQYAILMSYPSAMVIFFFFKGGAPLVTPFDYFMAALTGIGMGALGIVILRFVVLAPYGPRYRIFHAVTLLGYIALFGLSLL